MAQKPLSPFAALVSKSGFCLVDVNRNPLPRDPEDTREIQIVVHFLGSCFDNDLNFFVGHATLELSYPSLGAQYDTPQLNVDWGESSLVENQNERLAELIREWKVDPGQQDSGPVLARTHRNGEGTLFFVPAHDWLCRKALAEMLGQLEENSVVYCGCDLRHRCRQLLGQFFS